MKKSSTASIYRIWKLGELIDYKKFCRVQYFSKWCVKSMKNQRSQLLNENTYQHISAIVCTVG